ncbi:DEAD/DEAH box helicase family protein [Acinetobacter baumannii]|nr:MULTISPECIES: DEAD/DEAH box helicase family protein [Acinetobacter calcoaceticus/baumannii complex]EKP58437.1 type III restriction enzyme, res subunit [Acinetobacter baumannii Naval-82]KQE72990.1 restriction endonuclease subunit R [Acinetobacter baumannii]MBJ8449878.1 DEAD/DEAH box helicase family protein [Acinetobacter pittii]MCT9454378.1 DEAD/DEAH box helicase family protein [Acinetobacter baumannii]MDV4233409.1 DEAD/DEAH box helicase family protein [Acinetobacter baumannii]
MSNFEFLESDFPSLAVTAKEAEKLVYISPQFALAAARTSLESLVLWLYQYDKKLTQPYDSSLHNLINDIKFKEIIPPYIWDKMDNIRMVGNSAVHGKKFKKLTTEETVNHIQHLFLMYTWFERNYGSPSKDRSQPNVFKTELIPNAEPTQQITANQAQLQKEIEAKEKEFAEQHKALREREQKLFELSANLEEREKLLADIDANVAQKRAEVEQAKLANSQVQDHTDYKESETRKLKIDLMLEEAGWEIGNTAKEEVPVSGMPSTSGNGAVDYVLYDVDGKPLAIVEAKRSSVDPDIGQQQAKLYADCLEKETGQRPVIFYTNGLKTRIWNDVQGGPPRLVHGFYTQAELKRLIERRKNNPDLSSFPINTEIVERYYQTRAIKAMLAAFQRKERAGLLIMATGTGKTRTAIALVDVLMKANVVQKTLFLADRTSLVNQAHNAFKANLKDASFVNLLEDKNQVGRVYFSTYQTMMGLIDERNVDGTRKFGTGMFDLIIVDEAHRSVYQKFGEIFNYFDSLLVGLTATPRDEVDRDTYQLFGLEKGVPTDYYDLDQAIADGYLVPPKAYSVPLKFMREGVKYNELSEDEKLHWESLNWGTDVPDEVSAAQVNKQLFNQDTVDKMLAHLMENGIKVEGGDVLGKTIIFAVNQNHANFIADRFNANYPKYDGKFARVITHSTTYAQDLIDQFSDKKSTTPQIAISVDMLDTGIDVPEVVNLVFFKAVRSKVKFMQMIGRGTRLCEDLFAPDEHKKEFFIFDYCSNFEYFNENPDGAPVSTTEPLGQRLFKARLNILSLLNAKDDETDELKAVQQDMRQSLQNEVKSMNNDNFIVKSELEHVEHFKNDDAWNNLDDLAIGTLREHISKLPNQLEPETLEAKLFDMLCYNLELAVLEKNNTAIQSYANKVIEIASKLESKENIPVVAEQIALIQEIQTVEYWKGITLPMLEAMRKRIRGLVKLIEKSTSTIVYSMLDDEIGEMQAVDIPVVSSGVNLAQYRKRVESFIKANENHITIAKLKRGLALTPTDLSELERFVFEAQEVESRDKFEECFGTDQSLPMFIRSLVGLDRKAVQEAFSKYLQGSSYNEKQIRFIEMMIDHLTQNGVLDAAQLYEAPFNQIHYEGVDGVFDDADADNIFGVVEAFNEAVA